MALLDTKEKNQIRTKAFAGSGYYRAVLSGVVPPTGVWIPLPDPLSHWDMIPHCASSRCQAEKPTWLLSPAIVAFWWEFSIVVHK